MPRAAAAAALLALAVLAYLAPSRALAAVQEPPGEAGRLDCTALLSALARSVELAARPEPWLLGELEALRERAPPGEMARLHTDAYTALERLVEAVLEAEGLRGDPARAAVLAARLPLLGEEARRAVLAYSSRLSLCTGDPVVATELGIRLKAALTRIGEELLPGVDRLLTGLYASPMGGYRVWLEPASVEGGGAVRVCSSTPPGGGGTLAASATLAYALYLGEARGPAGGCIEIRAPDAAEAAEVAAARSGGVPLYVKAYIVDEEGGVHGPVLLSARVKYYRPAVSVSLPATVRLGEPVEARIESSVPVNVTVYIDGEELGNYTVNGSLPLVIPPGRLGPGYHEVKVLVHPSGPYLRVLLGRLVVVVPGGRLVSVEVSNPAVSILNEVRLTLRAAEPVNVTVYVNGARVYEGGANGTLTLTYRPTLNPLPSVVDLNVTVRSEPGGIVLYEATHRVVVVNPLTVALALAASTAAALGGVELALPAPPGARRAPAQPPGGRLRGFQGLRLRLRRSRVARVYYRVLEALGVERPEPWETLREHYRRAVEPAGPPPAVSALLRLAEEDLYSPRAPPLEEALRLAGEARR